MNGENGSAKVNAPATGPSANGDAENEDSDDDKEDENEAPEGGAAGGGLLTCCELLRSVRDRILMWMDFFSLLDSGEEKEEASMDVVVRVTLALRGLNV